MHEIIIQFAGEDWDDEKQDAMMDQVVDALDTAGVPYADVTSR